MKPFETCPACEGDGFETYRHWGLDAARKCTCCNGFGIVSIQEMVTYVSTNDETAVTLDGERI